MSRLRREKWKKKQSERRKTWIVETALSARPHSPRPLRTTLAPRLTPRALAKSDPSTKFDFKSWATGVEPDTMPADAAASEGGQLGWDDLIVKAKVTLLTAKFNERTAFLHSDILPLAKKTGQSKLLQSGTTRSSLHPSPDLEQSQVQDLVRLLLSTIPRFNDQPSRHAVLAVLAALLAHEHDTALPASNGSAEPAEVFGAAPKKGISGGLIKWLESEVAKVDKAGTVAPGTRYVLLTWGTTIFASLHGAEAPTEGPQWTSLVTSISYLFYALLDASATPKDSVRRSVLVLTRRVVRNVSVVLTTLLRTLADCARQIEPRHHPPPHRDSHFRLDRSHLPPCSPPRSRAGRCASAEGAQEAPGRWKGVC